MVISCKAKHPTLMQEVTDLTRELRRLSPLWTEEWHELLMEVHAEVNSRSAVLTQELQQLQADNKHKDPKQMQTHMLQR